MGHVWIQGDNVYASYDSRHFGPVPYGLVQGKVFLRVSALQHLYLVNLLGLAFSVIFFPGNVFDCYCTFYLNIIQNHVLLLFVILDNLQYCSLYLMRCTTDS